MTAALQDPTLWSARPRRFLTVVDCTMPPGELPCTDVDCRYHLANVGTGEHRPQPTRDCALAVANEGPRTLDEVGQVLGLSEERVRQVEERALFKLRNSAALRRLFDETDD